MPNVQKSMTLFKFYRIANSTRKFSMLECDTGCSLSKQVNSTASRVNAKMARGNRHDNKTLGDAHADNAARRYFKV